MQKIPLNSNASTFSLLVDRREYGDELPGFPQIAPAFHVPVCARWIFDVQFADAHVVLSPSEFWILTPGSS